MRTYQDLLAVGENDQSRMDFIRAAIRDHTSSDAYKTAVDAALYYGGENPTINHYEKLLYDLQGRAHVDMYTANHKIASQFFHLVIDQEVSYLLGNGVTFGEESTKAKLGETFDQDVMDLLEYARVAGVSFGFWNKDHIDVFKLTEFVPLYDEMTGALMAGIRFWQIDKNRPRRITLYELDGYTEFKDERSRMTIGQPKRSYKLTVTTSPADGAEITGGENYAGFPIVPLYGDKSHKSAIVGKKNTIDALDLATSNMVNNVDEGNLIYWVLTGYGGMDDVDDVRFIERLKTLHVAHVDGDDAKAEAHTIEAPYEGTNTTIAMLKERLYEDFMGFNPSTVAANAQTATEITAAQMLLDLKADKIEREVSRFIIGILSLAGVKDTFNFNRNRFTNVVEMAQCYLSAGTVLPESYIAEKLLALFGDIDRLEQILQQIDADNYGRMNLPAGNE